MLEEVWYWWNICFLKGIPFMEACIIPLKSFLISGGYECYLFKYVCRDRILLCNPRIFLNLLCSPAGLWFYHLPASASQCWGYRCVPLWPALTLQVLSCSSGLGGCMHGSSKFLVFALRATKFLNFHSPYGEIVLAMYFRLNVLSLIKF